MSEENTKHFSLVELPDLPDSADNALKNLTDKPTKNIGATFADAWFLVFGSISQKAALRRMKYSHDLENYQKELASSINKIPEEKRTEPSIQITAQALENSKYCISSKQLREMFVNLISGTMNRDLEPHIHPSFPEILKQMNETDAYILKELKNEPTLPLAQIGVYDKSGGYETLIMDACILPHATNLSQEKISTSLAYLQHAGLIRLSYTVHINDKTVNEAFKDLPVYKQAKQSAEMKNTKIYFSEGVCQLTSLGISFIAVCVS